MKGWILNIIIIGVLYSQVGRVASLLEIPVADFHESSIPSYYFGNDFSMALNTNDNHFFDMDYIHFNVYFLEKFGAGINFFTTREIGIDFIYKFFSAPNVPSIALGVRNFTYARYISSAGGKPPDGGFKDENYTGKKRRNPEIFSIFIVSSYSIRDYNFHLGIGRGEFVGYGPHSKYLNTDVFADTYHELAFGLFAGFEYKYSERFNYIVEIDGRDLTLGFKGKYGMVNYFFEITKLELWIWRAKSLYPRIAFGWMIRIK